MLTLGNKLVYFVTLLQPSDSQDGAGQPGAHSVYKRVNANVEDLAGNLLEKSQLLSSEVNTRITIRYNKIVRAGWQVLDSNDETYRVDYVRDPGIPSRNVFMELLCKKTDDLV